MNGVRSAKCRAQCSTSRLQEHRGNERDRQNYLDYLQVLLHRVAFSLMFLPVSLTNLSKALICSCARVLPTWTFTDRTDAMSAFEDPLLRVLLATLYQLPLSSRDLSVPHIL